MKKRALEGTARSTTDVSLLTGESKLVESINMTANSIQRTFSASKKQKRAPIAASSSSLLRKLSATKGKSGGGGGDEDSKEEELIETLQSSQKDLTMRLVRDQRSADKAEKERQEKASKKSIVTIEEVLVDNIVDIAQEREKSLEEICRVAIPTANSNNVDFLHFLELAKQNPPEIYESLQQAATSSSSSTMSKQEQRMEVEKQLIQKKLNEIHDGTMLNDIPIDILMAFIQQRVPFFNNMVEEEKRRRMADNKVIHQDLKRSNIHPVVVSPEHVAFCLLPPHWIFPACSSKTSCVAYANLGTPLLAFVKPEEVVIARQRGVVTSANRRCYLCYLFCYNFSWYTARNGNVELKLLFSHIAGKPGHYDQNAMIKSPGGERDSAMHTPLYRSQVISTNAHEPAIEQLREYKETDYVVCSREVDIPYRDSSSGKIQIRREVVTGLRETSTVLFVKPATIKKPHLQVDPYVSIEVKATKQISTCEILSYFFSKENKTPELGVPRLRNVNGAPQKDYMLLHTYWSLVSPCKHIVLGSKISEYEMMPFNFIFCDDIRITVKNIRAILRGGRIYLHELQRQKMDFPVDITSPLSVFEKQLDEPYETQSELFYSERQYFLAFQLRKDVTATILYMYQDETPSDFTIRTRLQIFMDWNESNYGRLFSFGKTKDSDLDQDLLEKLCESTAPIHHFADDQKFIKTPSTFVHRLFPREHCKREFPKMNSLQIFSEFNEMISLFKSGRISTWKTMWMNRKHYDVPEITSIIDQVLENSHSNQLMAMQNYGIVWALFTRINHAYDLLGPEIERRQTVREDLAHFEHYCENLINKRKKKLNDDNLIALYQKRNFCKKIEDNVHELYSFIYTHLNLVQRMCDFRLIKDNDFHKFVPRKKYGTNSFISHYEEVNINDFETIHEGSLPDMPYVTCVNFIDDLLPNGQNNKNLSTFIYMCSKLVPRVCYRRTKEHKQWEYCKKNTAYMRLTRQVLIMTLSGGYRHCNKQGMNFERILSLHKSLGTHYDEEKFLNSQKDYPFLNLLAMREALVFWTRKVNAYRSYIISKFPEYVIWEKKVIFEADKVREAFAKPENGFPQLEFLLRVDPPPTLNDLPFVNPELKKRVATLRDVYRHPYINSIEQLRKHIVNVNIKLEENNYKHPRFTKRFTRAIIASVFALEPGKQFNVCEKLREFNSLIPKPITDVRDLVFQPFTELILLDVLRMMARAEHGQKIESLLLMIPPKDWELIDIFTNTLSIHYSFRVYDLPEDIQKAQYQALVNRSRGHEPSIISSSILISLCCGKVRSYTSHNSTFEFIGASDISLCPKTGRIFCKQDKKSAHKRRETRNIRMLDKQLRESEVADDDDKMKKIFKGMSKTRIQDPSKDARYGMVCTKFPIPVIPLVGKVVIFKNTKYTICPRPNCGAICTFSLRLYGINGFSCISCESYHFNHFRVPRCIECDNTLKFPKVIDAEKIRKNGGYPKEENMWNEFVVLDDSSNGGSYQFERRYICARCFNTKTSNFDGNHFISSNDLRHAKHIKRIQHVFDTLNGDYNLREEVEDFDENVEDGNKKTIRTVKQEQKNFMHFTQIKS